MTATHPSTRASRIRIDARGTEVIVVAHEELDKSRPPMARADQVEGGASGPRKDGLEQPHPEPEGAAT